VSTTTENVIPLLSAYSAMSFQGNSTSSSSGGSASSSPTSFVFTESYQVVYASSTTYKVTVVAVEAGTNITETAWVLRNGTAVAVDVSGQNFTGAEAKEFIVSVFAGFTLQVQADSEIGLYTSTNYFHASGTSTENIGSTQVAVTTYSANTLPETVVGCGSTSTITAFSFSVGTPKGASTPLVIYENIAGSDIVSGQTQNYEYTLQVTSITVA
jgi:hypothetical protein